MQVLWKSGYFCKFNGRGCKESGIGSKGLHKSHVPGNVALEILPGGTMRRFRPFQLVLAVLVVAGAGLVTAGGAVAQAWQVNEPEGGATAFICPEGEEGTANYLCFRLECAAFEPLHFAVEIAGRGPVEASVPVTVGVDGGDVGVMNFTPHAAQGHTRLTAAFDPRIHQELVDLLQRGLRASLRLDWPDGAQEVEIGLNGSSDALYTVMQACPMPSPPVDNPASLVLGEVVAACEALDGTVAMDQGFERREDLDGDGREDLVIDYAAAVCSSSPTLNCSTGGCTVGFFLARDEGYVRMFSDVIRGYEVFAGGFLALDMHGTACGLYGFEACRKVFDIAGDAPVLVEEIAGPEAETVTIAGPAEAGADAAEATGATVVAVSEGVTVEPEAVAVATAEAAPVEPGPAPEPEAQAVAEAPTTAPVEETVAAAEVVRDPAPETDAATALAPAPDAGAGPAPQSDEVTVAAASPEGTPPAAPAANPAAVTTAAGGWGDDDGPTSRHDAGPAPALPEGVTFNGDGTLFVPEDAAQ